MGYIYWGYMHLLSIDPNFLGHPSRWLLHGKKTPWSCLGGNCSFFLHQFSDILASFWGWGSPLFPSLLSLEILVMANLPKIYHNHDPSQLWSSWERLPILAKEEIHIRYKLVLWFKWRNEPRKTNSYFPLNPGCSIGILLLIYDIIPK